MKQSIRLLAFLTMALSLSGCNIYDRLTEVGAQPKLASVQDPSPIAGVTPVSMPMPAPFSGERHANSLWRTGSRAFFRDQRATRVGDILTVIITINDQAQLQNETKRSRVNSDNANASSLFGYESQFQNLLPSAIDPTSLVAMGSDTSNDGKGSIARTEQINLRVAATITQILPNGNMVLAGKQQVAVNFDTRELEVAGVIRPEDITTDNTVNYDQIAEARISYGGKGHIQDVQQPRYGSQVFDILMPF